MRIAILGAPATGKTRLAQGLMQHLPALQVTDNPPLQNALRTPPSGNDPTLQALARDHRRSYDLTLLTGLDLPPSQAAATHLTQTQQEQADAWLRATLQQAGIAYGVVYGNGPQRLRNALRLITPEDVAPGNWNWVCEKCSDPACEYQLFTGLKDLKAGSLPPA